MDDLNFQTGYSGSPEANGDDTVRHETHMEYLIDMLFPNWHIYHKCG